MEALLRDTELSESAFDNNRTPNDLAAGGLEGLMDTGGKASNQNDKQNNSSKRDKSTKKPAFDVVTLLLRPRRNLNAYEARLDEVSTLFKKEYVTKKPDR